MHRSLTWCTRRLWLVMSFGQWVLKLRAGFRSSVEKNAGWNRVTNRPGGLAVKRFDLDVASFFWVGLDDRISPETTVV